MSVAIVVWDFGETVTKTKSSGYCDLIDADLFIFTVFELLASLVSYDL